MTANDSGEPPMEDKKIEHINLRVLGQDGTEIAFKIKRTTPLKKLMDAYVTKTGLDFNSVRFTFDGDRLRPEQTPNELEMEDNDQIQTAVTQIGG